MNKKKKLLLILIPVVLVIIIAVVLGVIFLKPALSSPPGGSDNPENPGSSIESPIYESDVKYNNEEERTAARADQLAKAVLDLFIDNEIYEYDGEIYMYDTYKPWSKESEGNASVWHYTSVVAMASRLYAISEGETKAFYEKWVKDLWKEMDWYKGTGLITSYNSSEMRTMYAVNRAFMRNTANVTGINAVYDDQMWILKELIYTYQRTGDEEYLTLAEDLTETCLDGWDTSENPATGTEFGGITWGPGYASKHTCSNAPLISPLVELYEIYKEKGDNKKAKYYLDWAEKVYDFSYSTFRNSNNLYGDLIGTDYGFNVKTGLKETVSHGSLDITEYTYNTGTMIQGGAKLYAATGKKNYLTEAQTTAEAAELVFGLKDEKTGLNEYVTTSTLWFNLELLMGYIDLAKVDDSEYADITKGYVENFRKTLDYAYDNYYVDGVLPRNLIQGWTYGNTFDRDKNVMDSASAAEMYAMLYQYYKGL